MAMTLLPMFDVPVFWPILLLYWLLLFAVTMKRQIKHMIKYRYLPFSTGKKVSTCWVSAGYTAMGVLQPWPATLDQFITWQQHTKNRT
jgi:hypothetical protein